MTSKQELERRIEVLERDLNETLMLTTKLANEVAKLAIKITNVLTAQNR